MKKAQINKKFDGMTPAKNQKIIILKRLGDANTPIGSIASIPNHPTYMS